MRTALQFLNALRHHWVAFITSSLAAAGITLVLGVKAMNEIPAWGWLSFAGVGLLIAAFRAWKDERTRANEATRKMSALTCAVELRVPIQAPNGVFLLLQVCIRNPGSDTALDMHRLEVKPVGMDAIRPVLWYKNEVHLGTPDGKHWQIKGRDILYGEEIRVFKTGEITRGWLIFLFAGRRLADIQENIESITLYFDDAWNKTHSIPVGTITGGEHMFGLPPVFAGLTFPEPSTSPGGTLAPKATRKKKKR